MGLLSVTLFDTSVKVTLIHDARGIRHETVAVDFTMDKVTLISFPVLKYFDTFAMEFSFDEVSPVTVQRGECLAHKFYLLVVLPFAFSQGSIFMSFDHIAMNDTIVEFVLILELATSGNLQSITMHLVVNKEANILLSIGPSENTCAIEHVVLEFAHILVSIAQLALSLAFFLATDLVTYECLILSYVLLASAPFKLNLVSNVRI